MGTGYTRLWRSSGREASGRVEVDVDRVAYPEDQDARILHAPLRVWHGEMGRGAPMVGVELHFDRDRDFVVSAVDGEHTVHLHGRGSSGSYFPFDAIRT